MKQEWIKLESKSPEYGKHVLLAVIRTFPDVEGFVTVGGKAFTDIDGDHYKTCGGDEFLTYGLGDHVTHWMELPSIDEIKEQ